MLVNRRLPTSGRDGADSTIQGGLPFDPDDAAANCFPLLNVFAILSVPSDNMSRIESKQLEKVRMRADINGAIC